MLPPPLRRSALLLPPLWLALLLAGCYGGAAPAEGETGGEAAPTRPRAVVTVGTVRQDTVREVLTLSAISAYPAKDILRATTTGYVLGPAPVPGQRVRGGELVFRVQTKESRVLHLDQLTGDPALRFSGVVRVAAPRAGVLSTVDKLPGDYVLEGEPLGTIYDQSRFGFVLDVPVTQLRYVRPGQRCRVLLPDGRRIRGRVGQALATGDLSAQTQRYLVRPIGNGLTLPENVVVRVEIDQTAPYQATTLPRAAVLSDETQTNFWVMRLLNDSVAVRVAVVPGPAQPGERLVLRNPRFNPQDRLLLSGNYGLDDTAAVTVKR